MEGVSTVGFPVSEGNCGHCGQLKLEAGVPPGSSLQLSRGKVSGMGVPHPHAAVAGTLSGPRSDCENVSHPSLILY